MQYLKDAIAQVDAKIDQLQMVREVLVSLNGFVQTPLTRKAKAGSKAVRRGGKISRKGIEAIRAAQKARWAKVHAAQAKGKKR